MRNQIKEYTEIFSKNFDVMEPVYEFGSLQVEAQEGYADLRPFFSGKEYVGCDMRKGPGVDRILNLHNIDLPDESIGTVLCLDTLEHVEYPHKALEEIYRILKKDGIVVISSVMNFEIHDYPYDYWRFTPEAFKSILKPFKNVYVESAGSKLFPHTVVGVGIKGEKPQNLENFIPKSTEWSYKWSKSSEYKTLEEKIDSNFKNIDIKFERLENGMLFGKLSREINRVYKKYFLKKK